MNDKSITKNIVDLYKKKTAFSELVIKWALFVNVFKMYLLSYWYPPKFTNVKEITYLFLIISRFKGNYTDITSPTFYSFIFTEGWGIVVHYEPISQKFIYFLVRRMAKAHFREIYHKIRHLVFPAWCTCSIIYFCQLKKWKKNPIFINILAH